MSAPSDRVHSSPRPKVGVEIWVPKCVHGLPEDEKYEDERYEE